jgi:ribosomal protein S12 methylthiotransferase accessory factor
MITLPGRLGELVSPKVGVIRGVAPQARGTDEPLPPYLCTATLSNFDFRTADRSERVAAGKGRTEEEAIAAAVGEAMERYCASHWDPQRTFSARWRDIAEPAITPAECVLYMEHQYAREGWPYARWREDQDVTWIRGRELPTGTLVALPASLVYLVSPPPRADEWFVQTTSNGLGAGPTRAAAVLSALCEVMERDALLGCWFHRLPATELDLDDADSHTVAIRRQYAHFGVDVRAFLLPSDLPAAVVMAVSFESTRDRPGQVVGMGCHPNPRVAVQKAIFEMCQGRPAEAHRFVERPPQGRLQSYEDVKTLDDHSAFAGMPERREEFAFLWASGARAGIADLPNGSLGEVERDLDRCARALTALGSRVAFVELTTPDIAPYDIHVSRVIATGLQPVHFGCGQERLGGDRLFELPRRLGFGTRRVDWNELNPCPHPLA